MTIHSDCPLCGSADTGLFCEKPQKRGEARRYFRCRECELVHLDPAQRLPAELEKARYELHRNFPGDAGYEDFLETLAAPLAEGLPSGAEGLDFGCGPSETLRGLLRRRGLRVEGYDPFFADDRRLLQRRYAFVACSETIEHFHAPGREFVRLAELLERGGRLGILTGVLEKPGDFADWSYHRDPTHVSFYSPGTLRWIASSKGWSAAYPHPRVVIYTR